MNKTIPFHVPESLHKEIKLKSAMADVSIEEYIMQLLEDDLVNASGNTRRW